MRGAGFLFTDGTRVFLIRRAPREEEGGSWGIPGGYCEGEETESEAALRETKEEIGSVPSHIVLDYYVYQNPFDEYACEYTTFLAEVPIEVPESFAVHLKEDEHDSWGWFGPDDLNTLHIHPKVEMLLEGSNPFYGPCGHRSAATGNTELSLQKLLELPREELERFPTDLLDRAAFGISEGIYNLPIGKICIRYEDDYGNAVEDVKEEPEKYVALLDEPVEVALDSGIYWLEDGHHRFVTACNLGHETIKAHVEVKDNPVRVIMEMRGERHD